LFDPDTLLPAAKVFINYNAIDLGAEGVLFTHPDVEAGVDFRAALAYEDIPRDNELPAIFLDA
jgi:hypothetical protein